MRSRCIDLHQWVPVPIRYRTRGGAGMRLGQWKAHLPLTTIGEDEVGSAD